MVRNVENYAKPIKIGQSNYKEISASNDALTSVITTVAVIAIVMGFIVGPYFLIVIPEQIKQNESAHLKDVEEEFLDIRGTIYNQLDTGTPDTVQSSRIKLGTEDQDLFVTGGDGELDIDPTESVISVYEYYDELSIYARGSGQIKYGSRNFYHPNKRYTFENGAIISEQRSIMSIEGSPDFKIDRNEVLQSIGLDSDFGKLTGTNNVLTNIFLINTFSTPTTIARARVTWEGGNGSFLNQINIAGNPIEWSGSAASGVLINLSRTYLMDNGIERINLHFNADMLESSVTIELFTSTNSVLSDTWPNYQLDTITHCYDIEVPSENAKKFKFRNTCNRPVTITNIAVSWNGSATLRRINIENHGGDVWTEPLPGAESPLIINVTKLSKFSPNTETDIRFYFNGLIDGERLNVKFFCENSTNIASTSYPVSLNQTYINISMSTITLVTKTGDKIHTTGKSTKVLKTTLISAEQNNYNWEKGEMLVLNITTKYGDAWIKYLNETFTSGNGLIWDYDGIGSFPGEYFITTEDVTEETKNVNLILNSVNKLECVIGIIKIELS